MKCLSNPHPHWIYLSRFILQAQQNLLKYICLTSWTLATTGCILITLTKEKISLSTYGLGTCVANLPLWTNCSVWIAHFEKRIVLFTISLLGFNKSAAERGYFRFWRIDIELNYLWWRELALQKLFNPIWVGSDIQQFKFLLSAHLS